ncbi:MAG: M28 family peptidase [Bryobacterales bacterium]|nr:M28 family peptidase [Bryobacterales bacterium]
MFSLLLLLLGLPGALPAESAAARRWWAHVEYLAGDKLQGRDTGSDGHKQAARYVAQEFERAGLRPASASGYFQPVPFRSLTLDEPASSLELRFPSRGEKLTLGIDAYFGLRGNPVPQIDAEMVFVGYGFAVPEHRYDELAGLDLNGKVAVYLTGSPKHLPPSLVSHYQSAEQRWRRLKEAGAVGVAILSNPTATDTSFERSRSARFVPAMRLAGVETEGPGCTVTINPAQANRWLDGAGHTFEEILSLAAANKPLPKFPLHARLAARMKINTAELLSDNIAGLKEGTHPRLKNELLVLSAHVDHVGVSRTLTGDKIYNGAMDNASGIASLIEIAKALKGKKLKRSVLFLALTGEEKGLLGSQYFVHSPTAPRDTIVANLNFDMFLPLFPLERVIMYGLEESTLADTVTRVAAKAGIEVIPDPEPQRNRFIRSDQYSFIRRGIPAAAFKLGYKPASPEERIFQTWMKERYHAVSDDLQQPVDKEAAVRFNKLMQAVAAALANASQRPAWKQDSFFKRFARP